jgi:hypothetical protein
MAKFWLVSQEKPFPNRRNGYLQALRRTFFFLSIGQDQSGMQIERAAGLHKSGNLAFAVALVQLPADLYRKCRAQAMLDNKVTLVSAFEIIHFRLAAEQFRGNHVFQDSAPIFGEGATQGGNPFSQFQPFQPQFDVLVTANLSYEERLKERAKERAGCWPC